MSKLIILPEVEDIKLFINPNFGREFNHKYNTIRENILANISNIDDEYYQNKNFGNHWREFKNKFEYILSKMTNVSYETYNIKHMGGMNYNYDFIIQYILNNEVIEEKKIEFKHNNASLSELPQFLELYDKNVKEQYKLCTISYAEFYYDNYLNKYLEIDGSITENKPNKDIYLKNVFDIKYKHPFFKNMHENKNNFIKEKRKLATHSISDYIQTYSNTFQFDNLTEKIKVSQNDKIFLLWDYNEFHIQKINVNEMKISNIIEGSINDMYFDVNVDNFIYNIRIRINWGNSGGLCNPRWKFTFIYK